MPPQFTQGDILRMLKHFHFQQVKKGSKVWLGSANGEKRTVNFHYHKDRDPMRVGTAEAIAHQFGFKNLTEMRIYLSAL